LCGRGTRDAFPSPYPEVYVMDADGSDETNLTNNTAPDMEPDWSPVPAPSPALR
jgi:hypothetical protein